MPRRTKVYWISKENPEKPNECHSRRCQEIAVRDLLCPKHHAAWLMSGRRPETPNYGVSHARDKSELDLLLEDKKDDIDKLLDEAKAAPTDEIASIEKLQSALEGIETVYAEVKTERAKQLEPLQEALKKVSSRFESAKDVVDKARATVTQRLEITRSTVRPMLPPAGRPQRTNEALQGQVSAALRPQRTLSNK